jgi:hypothetical protein
VLEQAAGSDQRKQEFLSELVVHVAQIAGNNLLPRSYQLDFFAPAQWIYQAQYAWSLCQDHETAKISKLFMPHATLAT